MANQLNAMKPSRETCATATAVAERSMPMPESLSSVSQDPFQEEDEVLKEDQLRVHDDLDLKDRPLEKKPEAAPALDLPLRFEEIGKVYPYPFDTGGKGLYRIFIVNRVEVGRLLCNFFPFLVRESTEDDGVEPRKKLTLGGFLHDGTALPEVEIPASDFAAMNWVLEKWGVDCRMEVGNSKPHIANAILTTAPYAERRTVYTVTGWKQIGGHWEYLLPGNSRYEVELGERLKGYRCEESHSLSDLTGTFSMIAFGLAPKRVLLPLLAFVFLTPLNHFLKEADCEPKFTLFLLGRTGSRKSTLAALMLSFFGSFTGSGLPLSFRDTANSVLYHLFQGKDILLCVDDFHPDAPGSASRMNGTAQAVMRAYGDRVGKNRLTEKCVPMASRPPQGNAILTGEFPPDIGESGTARYFPVELREGDVDLEVLSLFQDAAAQGMLRRCLYGYVQWIERNYLENEESHGRFVRELHDAFLRYRTEYTRSGNGAHGRLPEMEAWLRIGLEFFFRFLSEEKAASENQLSALLEDFESILGDTVSEQAQQVELDKPTHIFIRKLYALLESEQVAVLSKDGEHEVLPSGFVGYQDGEYLYLNMEAAHRAVKKLCADQGELFSISQRALLKALAEEGLTDCADGKNTRSVRFGSKTKRVACLIRSRAQEIAEGVR